MAMRRLICILSVFLVFPLLVQATSVRLINNSPYDLRAVIRGSDGSFLGEIVVRSQKETNWTDAYGQYGVWGGANSTMNENYRSRTPYTILWYCLDGGDYAVCDNVATGGLVMAQGCPGARMCKPQKKEKYPVEPEGHYLYQNPNLKQSPSTPPLNQ